MYLLSHIPPGSSNCLAAWSHQFARIVTRFSATILAQFYGHTHYDEFSVLYNNVSEPLAVAFIGPSITPHDGNNPGYRVYLADGAGGDTRAASHLVMDHRNYYLDLAAANTQEPGAALRYELEYSAAADLGLADMSARAWSDYISRLVTEEAEWARFWARFTRRGPGSAAECAGECRHRILCRLLTFDSSDLEQCEAVRGLVTSSDTDTGNRWYEDF